MKQLLCLLSFVLILHSSQAQSASAEAKAAYLLAEEAFNSADWKGTLTYLEQCKSKLGKPNSKMLYLELMTEMELAKIDAAYYDKALATIAAFEKAPDAGSFNEEKTVEVMKTKLRIGKLKEEATKKAADAQRIEDQQNAEVARLAALGGIVVYESGGHGLVVAKSSIGKMTWGKAKQACEDLVLNGHDDWYLPNRKEMQQIYQNTQVGMRKNVSGLYDAYWTSEATLGFLAWTIYFDDGRIKSWGKDNKYYVLPVRQF